MIQFVLNIAGHSRYVHTFHSVAYNCRGVNFTTMSYGKYIPIQAKKDYKGSKKSEFIVGSSKDQKIQGKGGDDAIAGRDGDDDLFGDKGNDHLAGDLGTNTLTGGKGDDIFFFQFDKNKLGFSAITDFSKNDRIALPSSLRKNLDISHEDGHSILSHSKSDTEYAIIENFKIKKNHIVNDYDYIFPSPRTAGNDDAEIRGIWKGCSLYYDDCQNLTDNDDIFRQKKAVSTYINGKKGNDDLTGNKKGDQIKGKEGNDTLNGGKGRDELDGGKGDDILIGGKGNDTFEDDDGSNTFTGGKGSDYFKVVKGWDGVAQIERPRSSKLFQLIKTKDGEKKVWCTFSHDQIDLDFSNPKVLLEFLKIIKFYILKDMKIFRLDAVAFLWKQENTSCINQPKTHYIIKLIRFISSLIDKDSIIITETNIPSKENLSYFGKGDEAHWIYNFTLSPLILYTLVSGDCSQLRKWSMTMPPAQEGNAYFNFLASHDGIGLRPVEGRLNPGQLNKLISSMKSSGAKISYKTSQFGEEIPYEINITYLDGLKSTFEGDSNYQVERFICAHVIMFAMEGIPAIYIHSLLGTKNNYDAIDLGEENRSINRYKWNKMELYTVLKNKSSLNYKILSKLNKILNIRSKQPAFHPNATQFTLNLGNNIFGIWRQDKKREQSIFSITNITSATILLSLEKVNLIETEKWFDLISGNSLKSIENKISIKPYQSLWMSNYKIDEKN